MSIKTVPSESFYGLYVWMMDNGKPFSDGDGNVLNVPGTRGDILKMERLRKAARYYGAPNGDVKFLPGTSRSSDDRYSEEKDRMASGLIPSETDIDAWKEQEQLFKEYQQKGWDWDRE